MSSRFEFWLTDDAGRRIALLKNLSFANYSRSTQGFGTIQAGIPYDSFISLVSKNFQPDWRLDVWRSPDSGFPLRREGSFFLRKYSVYQRTTDNVRMVELTGRSPLDILRRASVTTNVAANYTKTDQIDDMMKAVVTDNFITITGIAPVGEFSVEGDLSLGPTVTFSFFGREVLDILKDLKAASLTLNRDSSTNRKIFFDVVEGPGLSTGFGYIFRTYADMRGADRTQGVVFSVENGNLRDPSYIEDYLDEITESVVYNQSSGIGVTFDSPDVNLSRWNKIVQVQGGTGTDTNNMTTSAKRALYDSGADIRCSAAFVNSPGSKTQPRALYGVDWDLGDLLPVQFAGKNLTASVAIVHVSVNEKGVENIVGNTEVGV